MGNTVGSQRNLTKRQKLILIGMLLGDCCLEKRWKNTRLRIEHGLSQKDYLDWKYKEFKNLTISKPKLVKGTIHYQTKKKYNRWYFSTSSLPELNIYWRKFYFQNRKIIPRDIVKLLRSPLSLAIWFMDDGYKRNDCNALRISTDSFNFKEQKLLQRCLKRNFRINSKIHKKGEFWNIYISKPEAKNFCKIVEPYIVPKMKYKISLTP